MIVNVPLLGRVTPDTVIICPLVEMVPVDAVVQPIAIRRDWSRPPRRHR